MKSYNISNDEQAETAPPYGFSTAPDSVKYPENFFLIFPRYSMSLIAKENMSHLTVPGQLNSHYRWFVSIENRIFQQIADDRFQSICFELGY